VDTPGAAAYKSVCTDRSVALAKIPKRECASGWGLGLSQDSSALVQDSNLRYPSCKGGQAVTERLVKASKVPMTCEDAFW
jgi:hypothetical protein